MHPSGRGAGEAGGRETHRGTSGSGAGRGRGRTWDLVTLKRSFGEGQNTERANTDSDGMECTPCASRTAATTSIWRHELVSTGSCSLSAFSYPRICVHSQARGTCAQAHQWLRCWLHSIRAVFRARAVWVRQRNSAGGLRSTEHSRRGVGESGRPRPYAFPAVGRMGRMQVLLILISPLQSRTVPSQNVFLRSFYALA